MAKPIDIRAVNDMRQEVHQVMVDLNRRLLDIDARLAALLPPEDDRRERRMRRYTRDKWEAFLEI